MNVLDFELNPEFQNRTEDIDERYILKIIKIMKETYIDFDLEFHTMTDILAEYMLTKTPLILKLQRFYLHVRNYNICMAYLMMKDPKAYRSFIESEMNEISDTE